LNPFKARFSQVVVASVIPWNGVYSGDHPRTTRTRWPHIRTAVWKWDIGEPQRDKRGCTHQGMTVFGRSARGVPSRAVHGYFSVSWSRLEKPLLSASLMFVRFDSRRCCVNIGDPRSPNRVHRSNQLKRILLVNAFRALPTPGHLAVHGRPHDFEKRLWK